MLTYAFNFGLYAYDMQLSMKLHICMPMSASQLVLLSYLFLTYFLLPSYMLLKAVFISCKWLSLSISCQHDGMQKSCSVTIESEREHTKIEIRALKY